MKVLTSRFGELNVDSKDIITFKEGMLGFDNLKKYYVVDPDDETFILWLQSVEDGSVAFPIIEPNIFKHDYSIHLLPSELLSLDLQNLTESTVYTVLTIPKGDIVNMSANLKAPIVINTKTKMARQIVLQDSKLDVRLKIYNELKKSSLNFVSDDANRTKVVLNNNNEKNESIAPAKEVPSKNKNRMPEAD